MSWFISFPLLIIGVIALFLVTLYNSLVKLKMMVSEASSDIETFLKQRYDMIPNLVETVKGYAKHEQGIFEKVSELRSKAMGASGLGDQLALEGEMLKGISKIFAIAESYPELKANENFLNLQANLKDIETEIQKSRRFYNGTVKEFNTKLIVFPNNLLAKVLGFKEFPFFEAEEEEKKNVQVKF